MADPPRLDEAVEVDDEAISTAEEQLSEAERSPRSEEVTNEGPGATVIMVSGSPLGSLSPPAVEKASSDLENNATQCSDDQEIGSNPSLLGDLEEERDHGGRVDGGMNDPNEPEAIELGVCRSPYYCGGRPYRFYVLGELDRRRRRRFLVLIGAIATALLVLLVLIVGSTCGSGHCGGGGGGALSAATSEYNNPTNDTSQGEADPEFYHDRSPQPTPSPTTATPPPFALPSGTPLEMLGPNVVVFNSSVSTADIQAQCDAIFYQQQNNEMGTERYGIYFMPGVYGSAEQPLMLQIGYYTDVAGLGEYPGDVLIYGKIEVYNRCFEPSPYAEGQFVPATDGSTGLCFALNSFWRSLSNLAIQIVSLNQDSCRSQALFWAVSQASSMRRVDVRGGDMSLMDFCTSTFGLESKSHEQLLHNCEHAALTDLCAPLVIGPTQTPLMPVVGSLPTAGPARSSPARSSSSCRATWTLRCGTGPCGTRYLWESTGHPSTLASLTLPSPPSPPPL